jgi:hypothetical protein
MSLSFCVGCSFQINLTLDILASNNQNTAIGGVPSFATRYFYVSRACLYLPRAALKKESEEMNASTNHQVNDSTKRIDDLYLYSQGRYYSREKIYQTSLSNSANQP